MREAFGKVAPDEPVATLPREDFYEAAGTVQFIIRTGELRPYGNVILRKGVVNG
jgi:L-fucose mutarotase